jgi:hypothetical protein
VSITDEYVDPRGLGLKHYGLGGGEEAFAT